MTPLTDDELGALLRETFADHEHLADPDLALALATSPTPRPHRGRALLAAAAAVVLVAVGTTYVVARPDGDRPSGAPAPPVPSGQPPLPALQTDAGNRAAAVREAGARFAQVPAYPGSEPAGRIPGLGSVGVGVPGHTVTRSGWWTVSGVAPQTVARWYRRHLDGYANDGSGLSTIAGRAVVREHSFTATGLGDRVSPSSVEVEVATLRTGSDTAVRLSVQAVWPPARPLASYVQDVTSLQVTTWTSHLGARRQSQSFSVSDPTRLNAAARAFNALRGTASLYYHCPMVVDQRVERVVFHTRTGDVVARTSGTCVPTISVRRGGHLLQPLLFDPKPLPVSLGLDH